MSGTDFLYFSRNEPRENIKQTSGYKQYSTLMARLEQTKFRLRYVPQDNIIREREIVRVLTEDNLESNLRNRYKQELDQIRNNRSETMKELKESVDKQCLNLIENDYLKRFYTAYTKDGIPIENNDKKLKLLMNLGYQGYYIKK